MHVSIASAIGRRNWSILFSSVASSDVNWICDEDQQNGKSLHAVAASFKSIIDDGRRSCVPFRSVPLRSVALLVSTYSLLHVELA